MNEMKPCPFCGDTDAISIETAKSCEECAHFEDAEKCPAYAPFWSDEDHCPYIAVICSFSNGGCGASSGWYPTREKAIMAWNRRA